MNADVMMTMMDLVGASSGFSHYVYWKRQHMIKLRTNVNAWSVCMHNYVLLVSNLLCV